MIEIKIKAVDKKIWDGFNKKDTTLGEVCTVVYRLEQIKKQLLELDFDSDLEVNKKW